MLEHESIPFATFFTRRCPHCGLDGQIRVRREGMERYRAGALVQDAFPELPAEQREQLISGTHSKCWDEMFKDEDTDGKSCPG